MATAAYADMECCVRVHGDCPNCWGKTHEILRSILGVYLVTWDDKQMLLRIAASKVDPSIMLKQVLAAGDHAKLVSVNLKHPHLRYQNHTSYAPAYGGDQVVRVRGASTSTGAPMTFRDIVRKVLGLKGRGHVAGIGRKVPVVGTSSVFSSQAQAGRTPYSQQEINDMMKKHQDEVAAARRESRATQDQLDRIVAFLRDTQGLSELASLFPSSSGNGNNDGDGNGDGDGQ